MKSARAFRTSPTWDEAGQVWPGLTFVRCAEKHGLVRRGEVALEKMTVDVWALASGTLLIVEAVRARRRVITLLARAAPVPRPTDGQR
jgi:hypothetical protein